MQLVFENKKEITKLEYWEFAKAMFYRPMRIAATVVGILSLVMAAVSMIQNNTQNLGLMFVLGILLVFLGQYSWRMLAARQWKMMASASNGRPFEVTVRFSAEDMEAVGENGNGSVFHYEQVTALQKTANLYIISLGNITTLLIHKDGFRIGKEAEFYPFMTAKCPKAKRPKEKKAKARKEESIV